MTAPLVASTGGSAAPTAGSPSGAKPAAGAKAAGAATPATAQTGQAVLGTGAAAGVHVVASGETLGGIAPRYATTADAIFQANRNQIRDPNVIQVGQRLTIPGGNAAAPPATAAPVGPVGAAPAGGKLQWPVQGPITTRFSAVHKGIDIAAPGGTPIKAAQSGTVKEVNFSATNGNYTIIDHGGGLQTYYGHQSATNVRPGQQVQAGQQIGSVGHTGMAYGDHLHFQVGQGGMWGFERDPLGYLG